MNAAHDFLIHDTQPNRAFRKTDTVMSKLVLWERQCIITCDRKLARKCVCVLDSFFFVGHIGRNELVKLRKKTAVIYCLEFVEDLSFHSLPRYTHTHTHMQKTWRCCCCEKRDITLLKSNASLHVLLSFSAIRIFVDSQLEVHYAASLLISAVVCSRQGKKIFGGCHEINTSN